MIAGVWELSAKEIMLTGGNNPYRLHQMVYGLFDGVSRDPDGLNAGRNFLFADKGGAPSKRILFLADATPENPPIGVLRLKSIPESFLMHDVYRFEVIVNPTFKDPHNGKVVAVRGYENICNWFCNRSEESWGFLTRRKDLQIEDVRAVRCRKSDGTLLTINRATVKGCLHVSDRGLFRKSFEQGIGRARAFGCGLLQASPIRI